MLQSKCAIRTHCRRAQQTHKSQQRFPVNKKHGHKHILYIDTSEQQLKPSYIVIMHHLSFMQTTSLGHSPVEKKKISKKATLYLQSTFNLKNVLGPSASSGVYAWQMTLWLWCCELRSRDRELCTDIPPNWACLGGCSAPWNLGHKSHSANPITGGVQVHQAIMHIATFNRINISHSDSLWHCITHIISARKFPYQHVSLSAVSPSTRRVARPACAQAPVDGSVGVTAASLTLQS